MATKTVTIKNKNIKAELIPAVVTWRSRYSDSINDDKFGRWGMVAYSGSDKVFSKGKVCRWEIAWIKKMKNEEGEFMNRFTISPEFPYRGKYSFETLEEAQKEVEIYFKWFIKNCVGGFKIKQKIKT